MATARSVEFAPAALRTLERIEEVAEALAHHASQVMVSDAHEGVVTVLGYRITYQVEDADIVVLTALPA